MLLAGGAKRVNSTEQVPIPVFNRRTDDAVPQLTYTRCDQPVRAQITSVLCSRHAVHISYRQEPCKAWLARCKLMCAHEDHSETHSNLA